jgi:mannan endo-1,6-alpha-mannosidase
MRLPPALAAAAAVLYPDMLIQSTGNTTTSDTTSSLATSATPIATTSSIIATSSIVTTTSTPAATVIPSVTPAPVAKAFLSNAANLASSLTSHFPNPNLALFAEPIWWWQSGSAVDGLLTYTSTTGDKRYVPMLQDTLLSEGMTTHDFMTVHATGNDDQAWWALAALTAAETKLPAKGDVDWATLARNVFEQQKNRWDTAKCNGGMKWKILEGDGTDGWHYKSTIANGLFFQLAARLGALTADKDVLTWAGKAYDWVESVGLIDSDFKVFDGTDDAKGANGCVDVNHDQWSYNVGVFLHGAAVMAAHTGEKRWMERTRGFLAAVKRDFVSSDTGRLIEARCDHDQSCDSDQVSFKGTLARWLGATAEVLPVLRKEIDEIVVGAAAAVQKGDTEGLLPIDAFNALEILDAGLRTQGIGGVAGTIGLRKRAVAGRVAW